MNINRQNYEKFFVMYIDNELAPAQRMEVETFIQQHEDLAGELALLSELVLIPDNITFSGKDLLYKNEQSINANNYEKYFLLYIDNELSGAEKTDVETFVLQHPELQDEYTLLLRTKLEFEVVKFKDKALLYRTVEKRRRVIPIGYIRFAVAASVIGLVAGLGITYFVKIPGTQPGIFTANQPPTFKDTSAQTNYQPTGKSVAMDRKSATIKLLKVPEDSRIKIRPATTNTGEKNTTAKVFPDVAEKGIEIYASQSKQETKNNTTSNTSKSTTELVVSETIAVVNPNPVTSSLMQSASSRAETDDDENTLLIGSAEINTNKLRGLMKKAATFFDKKSRNNESEKIIQIASFEIKTK